MPTHFSIGDSIHLVDVKEVGRLVSIRKGWAVVAFEYITLTVSTDRLRPITPCSPIHPQPLQPTTTRTCKALEMDRFVAFDPAIDLHGLSGDEAIQRLDRWIDQAMVAGHTYLKIIHGTGLGLLRQRVYDYLSGHVAIKKIIRDPNRPGGYGVTYAEL